jgi:hypothetical protein
MTADGTDVREIRAHPSEGSRFVWTLSLDPVT